MKHPDYQIDLVAVRSGYDRQTCWAQARAGAIPTNASGEDPTVVLTMQKLRLQGPDAYEGIHSLHSTDRGQSWSTPVEEETFRRTLLQESEAGPVERVVCDFWPKWHAASGTLLGTGHTAQFLNGVVTSEYPRITPYAVYDEKNHRWNSWETLKMPDEARFHRSGAGCTQRVDLPNGELLLPIYFGSGEPYLLTSTVVRCAFDGETLEYIEHGSELTHSVPRGFGEPSLAQFEGRFFLTLRNDKAGYIAVSEDGLHYSEPQPWRFDDGEILGSYNTQQHWIARPDGLFLAYTRSSAENELQNDHVFRHRAPILLAQVDPEKLCVLRETEREIIPNRGARLGNFGVTEISDNESWIVESEWMQNSGSYAERMLELLRERLPEKEVERLAKTPHLCGAVEQFGADNTVWAARLLWD